MNAEGFGLQEPLRRIAGCPRIQVATGVLSGEWCAATDSLESGGHPAAVSSFMGSNEDDALNPRGISDWTVDNAGDSA